MQRLIPFTILVALAACGGQAGGTVKTSSGSTSGASTGSTSGSASNGSTTGSTSGGSSSGSTIGSSSGGSSSAGSSSGGSSSAGSGSSGGTTGGSSGGATGSGCVVGGISYPAGGANPANACQLCDPSQSTTAWSNSVPGTACGTGAVCTSGTCAAGCFIQGTFYPENAANPTNGCQLCVPGATTSQWTSCPGGGICQNGSCSVGCTIAGTTVSAGAKNPQDACQSCDPSQSTTSWTSAQDGTSCGAGEICSAGSCASGCFVGGSFYASGATNPSNGCELCQPAQSTTGWSPQSGAAQSGACAAGQICQNGSCQTGCFIGGSFYSSLAPNPSNSCEICQPSSSTTAFSPSTGPAPAGGTCGAGQVCNAGSCTSGCYLGGAFVAPGATEPGAGCQACVPSQSTLAWSAVTGLAPSGACPAGDVCDQGSCQTGCFIGGSFFPNLATNPSNSCEICQPSSSTAAFPPATGPAPTGGTCGAAQVCNAGSCATGCYLGGAFVAPGATQSGAACQACMPTQSTLAWSSVTGPAPTGGCPAGDVCNQGSCQAGCYIAGAYYSPGAGSATNSCETCQNTVSTSGLSPYTGLAPSGGSCTAGQICNAGVCQTGCYVGGNVLAAGALQPGNSCEACEPTQSCSAWTPKTGLPPAGGTCGADQVCDNGACASGCFIDGYYRGPGSVDPNHTCRSCDQSWSTQVWAPSFQTWVGGTGSGPVVATDWNQDGKPDLVTLDPSSSTMHLFLNLDGGTLTGADSWVGYGTDAGSMIALPTGPNGAPEVFLANAGGNDVDGESNNGSGGFGHCMHMSNLRFIDGPCYTLPVGGDPTLVAGGTFGGASAGTEIAVANEDGTLGLIVGSLGSYQANVINWTATPGTDHADSLVAADFNGDGLTDLAMAEGYPFSSNGHVIPSWETKIWLAKAAGGFGAAIIAGPSGVGPNGYLAAADLDGDGHVDLAAVGGNGLVSVDYGDGTGSFPVATSPTGVSAKATGIAIGDVNADGRPDLIIATQSAIYLYLNLGNRSFASPQTYTSGPLTFISASGWTAPAAGSTYGSPTTLIGTVDSNGNGLALMNRCQ